MFYLRNEMYLLRNNNEETCLARDELMENLCQTEMSLSDQIEINRGVELECKTIKSQLEVKDGHIKEIEIQSWFIYQNIY